MNAVDLFATLLAQRRRVRSVEYSSFPAYNDLFKLDLIEETGVVSSVICDECDQPHDAKVFYEDAQYGYYCHDLGFISKPRSELIAVQPNLKVFVAQIAEALKCKRRKSSPLGKDTWRIGAIDSPTGDIVLYLHPRLQDAQDLRAFEAALITEIRSPFGVVLTSIGTLSLPPYATALLQDVLDFDLIVGKLAVDADLEAIAGVPKNRNGGRPNEYSKTLGELSAIREKEGRILTGRNAEAKALQLDFETQFPNQKCPSLSIVRAFVTKTRRGS